MGRIPQSAKRVFEGKIFDVWQWEQIMFDGGTATFEMLRRPNTASVIATVGEKILVTRERQPGREAFLSIPGGRCDEGEDGLTAAKRELLEETGYTSETWEPFYQVQPVSKIDWTIFTYVARNCTQVREPRLDAGEQIETRLLTFNEFLALADDPTFTERSLVETMLRARLDTPACEKLRTAIFGL